MRLFLLLLLFISASLDAQDFFADFPPHFNYTLRTDSLATIDANEEGFYIEYQSKDLSIGCYGSLDIEADFSLILEHPFLYRTYLEYMNEAEVHPFLKNYALILHGVKRQGGEWDSLFRARLNDYCVYGQHNYLYASKDYFIFTYQYTFNGSGGIRHLQNLGLAAPMLQALSQALETKELQNEEFLALDNTSLIAADFNFQGDYLMITGDRIKAGMPLEDIWALELKQETSPRKLELKSRNRARSISNYNQDRSNWFRDKARWWRYQNFIFVWVEGWKLKAYAIEDGGLLRNLEIGYIYRKVD